MLFYPGKKNNDALNTLPFAPEQITGCAMVNPHYRVDLAPGTRYIIDSGRSKSATCCGACSRGRRSIASCG